MFAERESQDHHVGGLRGLGRPHGGRSRGEDLGGKRDLGGVTGPGDQDPIAGGDRQARQDGADFPGPQDPDSGDGGGHRVAPDVAAGCSARSSRTRGMTWVPYSSTERSRADGGNGAGGGVDHVEPARVQYPDRMGDLGRDRLDRADVQRSAVHLGVEFFPAERRPAALRPDPVADLLEPGVEQLLGFLVGGRDEAGRVHPDRLCGRAELLAGTPVQIHVGQRTGRGRRR